MGKVYLDKIQIIIFLFIFIMIGSFFARANAASTSSSPCQIQNTFPAQMSAPVSEFGDRRHHTNGTMHTGADFFYYHETKVPIPQGCVLQKNPSGNLVWEQNSKKANGTPKGYGWYIVVDCGRPGGGDTVKMRLAHVPKQPFGPGGSIRVGCSGNASARNNVTGELTQGCSHSGAHYHTEVIIGDRPVDPQCVLGMAKTNQNATGASARCKKCPNVGPANLCDASVRSTLISHGAECTKNARTPIAGGSTVDPNTIKGGGATPAPPGTGETPTTPTPGDGDDGGTDMGIPSPGGGTGHTPPDIFQDPDDPDPPITPPAPDVPGTPGGPPNLVPEPAEGKEPKELSGCATDTWTAMVNQAVMETRREDILNKRFIVKPDTVLDYSCFDLYVKKTADDAGPIFSETKKWANLKVDLIGKTVTVKRELGSKSLDGALMDIVQSIAVNYRRGQFNNPLLAGSTPVNSNAGSTNCDVMAKVWKASKCKNFDDVAVFYTFEDLKTKEPREYPANMKCN